LTEFESGVKIFGVNTIFLDVFFMDIRLPVQRRAKAKKAQLPIKDRTLAW
jgi:hypothetical protein